MSAPSSDSLPQAPWRALVECIAAGFAVGLAATVVLMLVVVLFDAATAVAAPPAASPVPAQAAPRPPDHATVDLASTETQRAAGQRDPLVTPHPRAAHHSGFVSAPPPGGASGLDLALGWVLLLSGIAAVLLLGGRRQ